MKHKLLFFLFVLSFCASVVAQTSINLDQGLNPYGSYHGGNIDSVSLTNGNLMIHAPLVSFPQRGKLKMDFFLRYNNKGYQKIVTSVSGGVTYSQFEWDGSGVEVGRDQTLTALKNTTIKVAQGDGSSLYGHVYTTQSADGSTHQMAGGTGRSMDASGIYSTANGLIDRDGIQYLPSAKTVTDPNGNQIVASASGWTDTLGRVIPGTLTPTHTIGGFRAFNPDDGAFAGVPTNDFSGCPVTPVAARIWDLPGPNGPTSKSSYKLCFLSYSYNTSFQLPHATEASGTATLLEAIVQPDGTYYQFDYNSWLDLTYLRLPTGGTISYTYTTLALSSGSSRAVQTRTVDANDGTGGKTFTYSYLIAPAPILSTVTQTTVTDPIGNDTVHVFGGGSSDSRFETQTRWYLGSSSTGQLLKTVDTQYSYDASPYNTFAGSNTSINGVPTSIKTTWPNNQINEITKDYDLGVTQQIFDPNNGGTTTSFTVKFGNETKQYEYDYGIGTRGALLRQTASSYAWQSNSAYQTSNLLDLVSSSVVKDGSGNRCSEIDYGYDDPAQLVASGISAQQQHFAANGSRGNVSTTSKWLSNAPCTGDSGSWLTTSTKFYDTGMLQSSTDPGGRTTTYVYDSTFAGAYVTETDMPDTNGIQHHVKGDYDWNTGLLKTYTDQNLQKTNYEYDSMFRIKSAAAYPAGNGQTTFNYPDALTVERKIQQDSTSWIDYYVKFDGVGRQVQTQLIAPEGTVYTDTTYDALGRKYNETNPHFATSSTTDGTTTYAYDPLGRVTDVTKPDSGIIHTDYSGSKTTVTDESGRKRQSISDGLGRIVTVWEPNPSTGSLTVGAYETDYGYTPIGLTQVTQKGNDVSTNWRIRSFTYDSLSRLLTSNNPETGTITYGYAADPTCNKDGAGVRTKTDARSVTTTYCYDELHRLTSKTFSDSTPSSSWVYDSVSGFTSSYSIGRLVKSSTSANAQEYYSYDLLGRLTYQSNCRPSSCTSSSYPITAGYDLAGHLTGLTYPSGRYVTSGFSSAGWLSSVNFASLSGQTVNYPYLTVTAHHTTGAWKTYSLGNGVAGTEYLNNRLQSSETIVNNSTIQQWMDRVYSFIDPSTSKNNGNLWKATDQMNSARTQTFNYDQLNRISTATESAWGLSFNVDAWGNLLQQTATLGNPLTFNATVNASNKLVGYSYDTGGNLLSDGLGHSYAYDAESRIKSVNTTAATYTYAADGQRARKDVGSNYTEYIYFGGAPITERTQAGDWIDYIFAGGRRLAKAEGLDVGLHIKGTNTTTNQYSIFTFDNSSGLANYTIRSGDKLLMQQWQPTGSHGGVLIKFTDGSSSNWLAMDQDGYYINDDGSQNATHKRIIDLGPLAGKTISTVAVDADQDTQVGSQWNIVFEQLVLTSADGTVHPIYTGESSVTFASITGTTSVTGRGYSIDSNPGKGTSPQLTTLYYHQDNLGTTRSLTAGGGWPVWQGIFQPFGQEYNPQIGVESHKFTGKERDGESGLDYFGARYHGSNMGRFMSPDPLMASAHVNNPQSWNRYSYALNNPLRYTDPDGLYPSPTYNCANGSKTCLNDAQRALLERSTITGKNGNKLSGEALYKSLNEKQQNAFVNLTDRLGSIKLADGSNALSKVGSLTSIETDRIKGTVDSSLGNLIKNDDHFHAVSGALHPGFDEASYKSKDNVLNVQFSFGKGMGVADIDQDLYQDWRHAFEVISNHSTNSTTNQDTVRKMMIARPEIGITPSTDANWNRPQQ